MKGLSARIGSTDLPSMLVNADSSLLQQSETLRVVHEDFVQYLIQTQLYRRNSIKEFKLLITEHALTSTTWLNGKLD